MKVAEIRKKFANYFEKKGHTKVESSPLIPQNDTTLLFANAGMNQFKDFFTGVAKPPYNKAVSIQKCVRAGGKHNDLDEVGFTSRHHTFFEMLGNFSFGDYFKKEAIEMAWEFLTKELKLSADKLHVTVHRSDDEAFELWQKMIGIPKEKISRLGDKDNFWEMGDVGPCGPCTEIFFDHGEEYTDPNFNATTAESYIQDEKRYIEIWNLVFMQFEKTGKGESKPLPKPSVDTGSGLERLAAAVQGKYWNYDIDSIQAIIKQIEKFSGKKYTDGKSANSMRVIADHIRASVMLITDGVLPSNEGRGYVLRRIIRRAIRHLKELGLKEVTLYKLIPVVFETLGEEYPQNQANKDLAEKLLRLEEKKFLETLDQGLKFLNEAIEKEIKDKTLSGERAFKLYDTFGFPLDLTEIILRELGLKVDLKSFNECMKKQKEISKKSWKGGNYEGGDEVFNQLANKFGASPFTGYENLSETTKLLKKETLGDITLLIFKKTPFYAESGGQAGDKGVIKQGENILAHIYDCQKPASDLHLHFSKDADALEEGETYIIEVDSINRELTKRNHSATHLLQSALIQILGSHIKQAGSSVNAEKMRFDFTHPEAISAEELQQIEDVVNKKIKEALPVNISHCSKDEAIKKGAMALFGEKYGDKVRVLEMGNFSLELCGGTHVSNTSEISHFCLLSESSLSSGVRRIEGITSTTAIEYLQNRSQILKSIESELGVNQRKVADRVTQNLQTQRELQKKIDGLNDKLQNIESEKLFKNSSILKDGLTLTVAKASDGANLKALSDLFVNQNPKGVLVLYSIKDDQLSALVRAPKNSKIQCSNILKDSLSSVGGKGGGRPDMAQGSAKGVKDTKPFVEKVESLIRESL